MSRVTIWTDAVDGGDRCWLDELATVSGLEYETTYPGGDSQAHWQMTLRADAQHRAWDYGRVVGLTLGGDTIWHGNLDNPTRGTVWQMTAIGLAADAKRFLAVAAISGNGLSLDEVVDAAITRGLPFTRPDALSTLSSDIASTPSATAYIDQVLDEVASGQTAETYWSTTTDGEMSMGAAPTVPTYLLIASTPGGGRNLTGFATDAFVTYQSASGVLSVEHREATSKPYGVFEAPVDKSALGLIPATQADDYGDGFIARNGARARFTNTFQVARGQLLTLGGQEVDLASVRAGFLANVILTDPDSAGEVLAAGIPQVLAGGCAYDVDADVLTVTPVSSAQDNLTALLGAGAGLRE